MSWIQFYLLCVSINYIFYDVIGIKNLRSIETKEITLPESISKIFIGAIINYLVFLCLKYSLPITIEIIKKTLN